MTKRKKGMHKRSPNQNTQVNDSCGYVPASLTEKKLARKVFCMSKQDPLPNYHLLSQYFKKDEQWQQCA